MNILRGLILLIMLIVPAPFLGQALHGEDVKNLPPQMVKIQEGKFRHFFKKKDEEFVFVKAFYLDVYAVTNADFLLFVQSNPEWSKSKVSRLFADSNYLKHWEGDLLIGEKNGAINNSPVTNISWHAANAFSKWKGKRLPTTTEWEYAASADIDNREATNTTNILQIILDWYAKPTPAILPPVGSTFKNKWGVYDMHGLIWEWVFDFNNNVLNADSRSKDSIDLNLFCGASGNNATNKEDYAAFMRYGYRESLKGAYTVANLGFRCAKSVDEVKK